MIDFNDINTKKPEPYQTVLIRTKLEWLRYYVCTWVPDEDVFEEAAGEHYATYKLDEVEGWIALDDIEKQEIVHCKDCTNRYTSNCPLEVMHDTCDGDDYFYTYGMSEYDDFFCADGRK